MHLLPILAPAIWGSPVKFIIIIIILKFLYVSLCERMPHVCQCLGKLEDISSLGAGIMGGCVNLTWMSGTKLRSFPRTVTAFRHQVSSLQPQRKDFKHWFFCLTFWLWGNLFVIYCDTTLLHIDLFIMILLFSLVLNGWYKLKRKLEIQSHSGLPPI